MMRQFVLLFVIIASVGLGVSASATANTDTLILSVQQKSGDKIVSTIEVFANKISPHLRSATDQFQVKIDGKLIKVPATLLWDLESQRGYYSDDKRSGVITKLPLPEVMCSLGGDATGSLLYARTIVYKDEIAVGDDMVASHEMRPIYSEGENCLFVEFYQPENPYALKAAIKTLAILKTIKALNAEQ